MVSKVTFLRFNEINSIENLFIGDKMFSKDYTFYDEDSISSELYIFSKKKAKLATQEWG